MGEDIGNIGRHFVTCEEDIPQLVIDHYWGTESKPKPGQLTVTYDSILSVAILHDAIMGQDWNCEYNIIYFDQMPQIS
jgi:hypothetical protein